MSLNPTPTYQTSTHPGPSPPSSKKRAQRPSPIVVYKSRARIGKNPYFYPVGNMAPQGV